MKPLKQLLDSCEASLSHHKKLTRNHFKFAHTVCRQSRFVSNQNPAQLNHSLDSKPITGDLWAGFKLDIQFQVYSLQPSALSSQWSALHKPSNQSVILTNPTFIPKGGNLHLRKRIRLHSARLDWICKKRFYIEKIYNRKQNQPFPQRVSLFVGIYRAACHVQRRKPSWDWLTPTR